MFNIKSILKTIAVVVFFLALTFIMVYSETHYKRVGNVHMINQNEYVFTDATGNEWGFYDDALIPCNAIVQANFFDNNTIDYINDDMLIGYKIIGYENEIEISF